MTNYLYDRFDITNNEGKTNRDFKVGDEVIVHPDLRLTRKGVEVVAGMLDYAGKTAHIRRKLSRSYCLDIDKGCYSWQDYMLIEPQCENPDQTAFMKLLG